MFRTLLVPFVGLMLGALAFYLIAAYLFGHERAIFTIIGIFIIGGIGLLLTFRSRS